MGFLPFESPPRGSLAIYGVGLVSKPQPTRGTAQSEATLVPLAHTPEPRGGDSFDIRQRAIHRGLGKSRDLRRDDSAISPELALAIRAYELRLVAGWVRLPIASGYGEGAKRTRGHAPSLSYWPASARISAAHVNDCGCEGRATRYHTRLGRWTCRAVRVRRLRVPTGSVVSDGPRVRAGLGGGFSPRG